MSDRSMLDRGSLWTAAAILGAGGSATALVLYFLARVDLPLVLVVTCVSLPALALLLHVGNLLRDCPHQSGYLLPLKFLSLLSVCMSLLIILDLALPLRTEAMTVNAVVPAGQSRILHLDGHEQAVAGELADDLLEGDIVTVENTRVFRRIETLSIPAAGARPGVVAYRRSGWDKAAMMIAAVLFFLPAGVLPFAPKPADVPWNMRMYLRLLVPSYVLSMVAMGLWIKLFLLHVAHTIDKF